MRGGARGDAAGGARGRHHLGQVDGRVLDGSATSTTACRAAADAGRRAAPELVSEHLGTVVDADQDVFTALNDAGWTGGAFVYVPRGVRVEAPIVLTAISDAAGVALHRRVLVVLDEGAEAEVWEQYLSGSGDGETLLNTVVELRVGQNARLRFVGAPGHERAVLGLRLPARRGGARRLARLGGRGLRLGQRQGAHGDAAGRRGLARQGHRRLRAARPPAHRLRHHAGARRGQHARPTSRSAASSPTARARCGAG